MPTPIEMLEGRSDKPTRLRILHTEAATSFGGQEFCIYKEMIAMRERGHHLEAVCQPDAELGKRLREAGFTVHLVSMDGPLNFVRCVALLRRLLRSRRFDVVNTHSRRDTVLGAIAARLAGTPLIVRTRHLAKPINSLYAYTWLAHRVIAVSRYVRGQLLDGGARAEAIATIHSPVVLPQVSSGVCVRRELGLPDDALVIGCVAVMRADKGHRDLIDAFHRIAATFPNAHLVLVGEGQPLAGQLQAQAQALGLAPRVHFTGRRDDIGNVLMAFDVFALPTLREALGTVFIEAAAMGLPVVGTNVGGVPETMQAGVTGLLVPPADPEALAGALEGLLADPALRRRMGEAGRELIRGQGQFSAERTAALVEQAYTGWLAELRDGARAA
ncbi:glycosyltransferase family 4 protein [Achromobacter insolitus]|uniref:D-inositol-3-phosphate glycosyltransferase n=1 Tax=Achromobacter insolitus TaxID=217204 RepID=A0A6S7F1X6_9BURK|nr:glycosyltransferase family 4 protein [Achromobacter insolitus]MDQ6214989.1 glycosyltransferase family 4 protein [Achromobacter insolitus]CAB3931086.1 D-inositol-3-phosphate glycosyltransferase [Achromobacter insolitus]CAB3932794.1 D-inositol-3-phosphate glycosyltransferase [Achromobacter insolitus]